MNYFSSGATLEKNWQISPLISYKRSVVLSEEHLSQTDLIRTQWPKSKISNLVKPGGAMKNQTVTCPPRKKTSELWSGHWLRWNVCWANSKGPVKSRAPGFTCTHTIYSKGCSICTHTDLLIWIRILFTTSSSRHGENDREEGAICGSGKIRFINTDQIKLSEPLPVAARVFVCVCGGGGDLLGTTDSSTMETVCSLWMTDLSVQAKHTQTHTPLTWPPLPHRRTQTRKK